MPNIKKHTEIRPWGNFQRFTLNERVTVKIITIRQKEELSLQSHQKRSEFWRVLKGAPEITIRNKKIKSKKGQEFFISKGVKHRIRAKKSIAEILEISFGNFNENDIVRFEDKYGRIKK